VAATCLLTGRRRCWSGYRRREALLGAMGQRRLRRAAADGMQFLAAGARPGYRTCLIGATTGLLDRNRAPSKPSTSGKGGSGYVTGTRLSACGRATKVP
jgi:hypothetical protein